MRQFIYRNATRLWEWTTKAWLWIKDKRDEYGPSRFVLILLLGLGLLGILSIPKPNVMVAASITTETLAMTVMSPEEARFRIPRAIALTDEGEVCRENIFVQPKNGAELYFTKDVSGDVYISAQGGIDWRSHSGFNQGSDWADFRLEEKGDCAVGRPVRLPVAGTLVIGTVAAIAQSDDGPPSLLLDGQLEVYGRAVDRIFWIIGLDNIPVLPMEPDRLYLANTFTVPGGSELSSTDAQWWGFVDVEAGTAEKGMQLEASTNARTLILKAPAPRVANASNETGPLRGDVISLTLGAQLGNDPNVRWIFGLITFALFFVATFFQMPESRK